MYMRIIRILTFPVVVGLAAGGCMYGDPPPEVNPGEVHSDCEYEQSALLGTWRKVGSYNWTWGNGYEPIPEENQNSRISFDVDGMFRSFQDYDEVMAVPFRLVRRENPLNHEIACLLQTGEPGNATTWQFTFGSGDTLNLGITAVDAGSTVYVRDL